jgi:hypothetical protein
MHSRSLENDPRVQAALAEFEQLIRNRYPEATFEITIGGEPDGKYLTATVDLENTLEVLHVIMDRLLEVQIEEGLPVYVIPVWPAGTSDAASPLSR